MHLKEILPILCIVVLPLAAQQNSSRNACDQVITDEDEGLVSSPGYPRSNYPPNAHCTTVIEAPLNYVIEYRSTFLELEDPDPQSGQCIYDKVSLYDGDDLIDTYCGIQAIYPNATSTNRLKIELVSDFGQEMSGFEIKWGTIDLDKRKVQHHCNFDDSIPLCTGWTNQNRNYRWLFGREHTPSADTGPTADHTTGTAMGRYAYIEGSKATQNATAVLQSPAIIYDLSESNERCVRFWYHMFGPGIGGLAVYVTGPNSKRTKVAEILGDHGDVWHEAKYTITLTSLMSTVTFEGRRGTNYLSDIAIDDIDIGDGPCDDESGGFNMFRPGIGIPSLGSLPAGSRLLPRSCVGNFEEHNCPGGCDLNCDNFLFDFPETCARACHGNCACPIDTPILHNARCINYIECPDVAGTLVDPGPMGGGETTADPGPMDRAGTTADPGPADSDAGSTAAIAREEETTTAIDHDQKKADIIHMNLLDQIIQAIFLALSDSE